MAGLSFAQVVEACLLYTNKVKTQEKQTKNHEDSEQEQKKPRAPCCSIQKGKRLDDHYQPYIQIQDMRRNFVVNPQRKKRLKRAWIFEAVDVSPFSYLFDDKKVRGATSLLWWGRRRRRRHTAKAGMHLGSEARRWSLWGELVVAGEMLRRRHELRDLIVVVGLALLVRV